MHAVLEIQVLEVSVTQSHFELRRGWLERFVTRIVVAGFKADALSRDFTR